MFVKLLSILSLATLVLSTSIPVAPVHPEVPNPFVDAICSTNADPKACAKTASRCLFPSPVTSGETPLCQCKNTLAEVGTNYATWVSTENEGIDICVLNVKSASPVIPPPATTRTKPPVTFKDYLISKNPVLEHNLECCVGKVRGLFDQSGNVFTATWKDLTSDLTDAPAKSAILSGITACSGTVTSCDAFAVKHCITQSCYNTLLATP